jgi:hypothetical protein
VSGIKPLVYPVTVVSKVKHCGAVDAMDRLQAFKYIHIINRQFQCKKKEFNLFTEIFSGNFQPILNELSAVKKVLISFYLALPVGCMQMGDLEEDLWVNVTEPAGWNDGEIYIHTCICICIFT